MKNERKMTLKIFAMLVICAIAFAVVFTVTEAEHDCSGMDCAICRMIRTCEDLLSGFVLLVFAVAAGTLPAHRHGFEHSCDETVASRRTLTSLKVKLSD